MIKLFSGTSNPQLAEEVSKNLDIPLSKAEILRFGNSEVKVTIQEDVRDATCVIIQSTSNPTDTNLMELFLFADALQRSEAKKQIAIVPYFGYAKQNIQHRPGESVSVNVVIRVMEAIGFDKIYTFDLHDEATGGVFNIPFKNVSAFPLLANHLSNYFQKQGVKKGDVVFVSPDQGAVEKVRNFGTVFYGTENFHEAVIEKKRDQDVAHKAKPLDLYGDVKGKVAVIIDDMVVSGSTVIPAVELCLERGATKVYSAVVHHDFIDGAAEKLQNSKLEKFFTTNTIKLEEKYRFPKLEEISISSLIEKELK